MLLPLPSLPQPLAERGERLPRAVSYDLTLRLDSAFPSEGRSLVSSGTRIGLSCNGGTSSSSRDEAVAWQMSS